MHSVIELTQDLLRLASVTPHDKGCQKQIAQLLTARGFTCESMRFHDVDNLFAHHGTGAPTLIFLGHTDVVPTGPLDKWTTPPFEPHIRDGFLYGRGAADMKGSVAAFTVALIEFVQSFPQHAGRVGLLLTSDEEGPSIHGVQAVVPELQKRGEKIDYCLVGEPSCEKQFGDTIKVGRRGSLTGHLQILGKQGHIAYPQKADNPIPRALKALSDLCEQHWDAGSDDFPATSCQISNLNAGTGAGNIIPGNVSVQFNFRYGTVNSAEVLKQRVETLLKQHQLQYQIHWQHGGLPFLSPAGKLRAATIASIQHLTDLTPHCSTAGGTSDGRFIAPLGTEVVEFGPRNDTIHQIDECISITELERLPHIYLDIMRRILID